VSKFRAFYFIIFTSFFYFNAFGQEAIKDLPKKKVNLCDQIFIAWVADTDATRQRGLMNFRPLNSNEAMLFIFENEEERNFWMKNVPYDLDIAYFKKNRQLVSRTTMKGTSPLTQEAALPSYKSGGAAMFALEVAGGRLKKVPQKCKLRF
jgi:uncharacterized membrane protein (UPF0127 family)